MLGVALGLLLQVGGATSVIIDRAQLDPRAEVNFHATAAPETVYVGDAVLYELGVFIADEVRQRLRRNPEFVPPELRSVLAYDLRDTRGARTVVRDGRTYEVHVFRRALFPVAPGRVVVPPAKLSYAVPMGASFFSREETKLLRSESVSFVAIAPPLAGRPANWNGAVGDLRVAASVEATSTRVGDPFVLTLRVSGEANVHLLPRPVFALSWATVVPSAERVAIDTLAPTVRGTKEFDFLVTPSVEGRAQLPAIEYAFFDPSARRYRVARTVPGAITVGEGSLMKVDSTGGSPLRRGALPLRTVWSRQLPDTPDHSVWYLALAVLAPLPAIARLVRERPRRRAKYSPEAALHTLAQAGAADPARVRAALQAAMSARLGGTPVPWADHVELRRSLRHHGVTNGTIDEVLVLLARIDSVVYGADRSPIGDTAARAMALYDRIDEEAQGTRVALRALRGATVAVVVMCVAAALAAQTALAPRVQFNHAIAVYASGQPAAAATEFFDAARRAPRAAAAWVNAGTASWETGDTARAVVGWQRALRLDPLDDNVRRLLSLVGADAGSSNAAVWPIPRRLPAWFALFLWLGGWIALWRARRPRAAVAAIAAAAVLAVTSRVQYARLTDSRVVVMSRPAALRSLPAMGAEAGAVPLTGELLYVIDRSGVWVRVKGSGNRDGWVDAARVIDLNTHPLRD